MQWAGRYSSTWLTISSMGLAKEKAVGWEILLHMTCQLLQGYSKCHYLPRGVAGTTTSFRGIARHQVMGREMLLHLANYLLQGYRQVPPRPSGVAWSLAKWLTTSSRGIGRFHHILQG
jgi:hypothetical protein